MSPAEIITAVKDIAVGVAGAVTATVAILGFKNWSRELRGKAAFETARGLAKATYALRDAVDRCRSPMIFFRQDSPSPLKGYETYQRIFAARWKPVEEAREAFDTQTLEAEALWGQPIRDATNEFRKCLSELYTSIEAIIENAAEDGADFKSDREFGREMRANAAGLPDDPGNELSVALKAAVQSIEGVLRKHLGARG